MRTVNGVKFTNNGHSSRERLHLDVDGHSRITALKVIRMPTDMLCRAYDTGGKVVAQRSFPLNCEAEEILSLWWATPNSQNVAGTIN